jgi:hypothetical protein
MPFSTQVAYKGLGEEGKNEDKEIRGAGLAAHCLLPALVKKMFSPLEQ